MRFYKRIKIIQKLQESAQCFVGDYIILIYFLTQRSNIPIRSSAVIESIEKISTQYNRLSIGDIEATFERENPLDC
jgi:hypothetical protein